MEGKVQAAGRRVLSKKLREEFKEIQEENLDLLIESNEPIRSLEGQLDFLKRRKENTEKQLRIVEEAIAQQISLDTYIEMFSTIKEEIMDEKDSSIN